jgi:predicted MFS family arabinose efflux permease
LLRPQSDSKLLLLAMVLSAAAAISLGVTRFAYALLLPAMRGDLGWSYTLSGAMNTSNALGYFVGALVTNRVMGYGGPERTVVWAGLVAAVLMLIPGFFVDPNVLIAQRLIAGILSALVFVSGGILAARMGSRQPERAGLILGLYYGGTGAGIVVSALIVPWILDSSQLPLVPWVVAWWALALVCLVMAAMLRWPVKVLAAWEADSHAQAEPAQAVAWWPMRYALTAYALFGLGYIGYMTFAVALLREHGASSTEVAWFYGILGFMVMASSRLWAGLLNAHRGGGALARLNALLGLAVILPTLTDNFSIFVLSGALFGAVFLSIVASTTAFVRLNFPTAAWSAGIAAFTVVFAVGQVIGPLAVGWVADSHGGLVRGFFYSALALWVGAACAWLQKPVVHDAAAPHVL